MPLVNIMINQRAYTIACDDGEEEHLRELAKHVDAKVRELLETVGQVSDARLLLMAALLITDDLVDAKAQLDARSQENETLNEETTEARSRSEQAETFAVAALESASRRIADIAARLAEA